MFCRALKIRPSILLNSVQLGNRNVSSLSKEKFSPILLSIEGNIGAGKSTLLQKLKKKHPEWHFIDEPLETWSKLRNNDGLSVLEVFYKDRKRWAYTFQNCALLTRHQNIEEAVNAAKSSGCTGRHVFLTERCLDTDYHVFTKMLSGEGSIDCLEMELYERLLKELKKTATPLSGIIHVSTQPLICAKRIVKRSRDCESTIPLSYLESLHKHQSNWVRSAKIPTMSTDLSKLEDLAEVEEFIEKQLRQEE